MIPSYKGDKKNITGNELGNLKSDRLFNLKEDPGQTQDLSAQYPEQLGRMKKEFQALAAGYYKADVPEETLK
jgi:hypothetical protein